MANVQVTMFLADGAATETIIALNDSHRKYISVQAQDAGGKLGIGETGVGTAWIEMSDLDVWSPAVNITSKLRWIGDGLECVVVQDMHSNVLLSSDKLMLTSDGYPIYYNVDRAKNNPVSRIPVFR